MVDFFAQLERFPCEHQALVLFAEALVVVAAQEPTLSLLRVQASRALKSADLGALRGVRKAFHRYPKPQRDCIGQRIIAQYE